jgi:hypothetical protein
MNLNRFNWTVFNTGKKYGAQMKPGPDLCQGPMVFTDRLRMVVRRLEAALG